MKTTTEEIIKITNGINSLGNSKLPVVLSFKLKNIYKEVLPISENAEEERGKLLDKYGQPVVDDKGKKTGQMEVVDREKIKIFNEEYNKILTEEFDLNIQKIPASLFDDLEVGVQTLYLLDTIIEEK